MNTQSTARLRDRSSVILDDVIWSSSIKLHKSVSCGRFIPQEANTTLLLSSCVFNVIYTCAIHSMLVYVLCWMMTKRVMKLFWHSLCLIVWSRGPLQWRHNERDGVSNHRRLDWSSLCSGADQRNIKAPRNWPLWGEFTGDWWISSHRASDAEIFPFDDVIMINSGLPQSVINRVSP